MSASAAARTAALAVSLVILAWCQAVSVGVKAGVPFTASVVSFESSWSRNAGSANLNERHLAIWKVPLYLKYRLLDGRVRPFVSGGAPALPFGFRS